MNIKANIILFFTLITVIFVSLISIKNQKQSLPIISKAASPESIQLPTETPISESNSLSMDSPEGSKTLSVEQKSVSGISTYSSYITSNTDQQKTEIFNGLKEFSNLEIPYNSWSPDNVYFYLKDGSNYFVFQSSGDLFPDGSKYLSFTDLFKNSFSDYEIEDVTGWGGLGLIIINAKHTTDNQKVSFWFDVPSQSFIQLGTYFK